MDRLAMEVGSLFGNVILFFVILLPIFYYFWRSDDHAEKVDLYYVATTFNEKLVESIPNLRLYKSPRLAQNGHTQTFYNSVFRRSPLFDYERISMQEKDGLGTFCIDWLYAKQGKDHIPECVVIIVPGIAGHSKQHYTRNLIYQCHLQGWHGVIINHRGCNSPMTSTRPFTIGDASDVIQTMEHCSERFPGSPIIVVGFSMGGNMATNAVVEWSRSHRNSKINLKAGISVCQGYDGGAGVEYAHTNMPFYDWVLAGKMREYVKQNEEIFSKFEGLDLDAIKNVKKLRNFDEIFTCKIWKCENRKQYYEKYSCIGHLKKLDVPMLFVNARDDPLIPTFLLDPIIEAAKINPNVMLAVTKHGGHLGFLEGWSRARESWLDKRMTEYVKFILKNCDT